MLDFGVLNEGHDGVTIKNGKVVGAHVGIGFMNADGNRLWVMAVNGDCTSAALLLAGSNDNSIKDSAFFGYCNAVELTDSSRNHFVENRTATFRCAETGVCGEFHSGGGVYVRGGEENTFARNSITQGVFALYQTLNNVVRQNYVTLAYGNGIASSHDAHGANRIVRNEVVKNVVAGIYSVNGDEIWRNVVRENVWQGILVLDGPAELVGNRVERNRLSGILVEGEGAGALIRRNIATGNGVYGIAAAPGNIDGGGNKAFGNGNPLQCLNVACK